MPGSEPGPAERAWRQHQVVDVGPGRLEDRRRQRAPVLDRPLPALQIDDLLEPRAIKLHAHELRDRIERGADPAVAQVEGIVHAAERRHVDVHPLDRLVGRVIDRMRMPHPGGRAGGPFQRGRPTVDGELRFPVEDHEHLLAVIVEVLTDA